MALTRSQNSINSFENFKTAYGGTAAYQALGGDKGFSDALATNNSNYINSYLSVLMDADQLGGIAAFKADYNTNFLSNNDRLTAAVNELYGDRTELKDYTRYKQDENGNYETDDDGNLVEETYQDTEYNYTKQALNDRAAAEKQQYEYQLADEAKEAWSGWRKFWAGVGSFWGHLGASILDTIIDDVMYLGLGLISIGRRGTLEEYYTRTGWFQNYGAGFFGDLMDDYDITYTTLRKADGTTTTMGELVAGVANTLGVMIPSMLLNLVPMGGAISSATSIGAKIGSVVGKVVHQSMYWYSLYTSSIKDYLQSSPNITFNQASLVAFGVTAVQAAVTYVNSYFVYGGSYFDKLTLGINNQGFIDTAVSGLRSGSHGKFFNNGVVRFVTDVLVEGYKQWQEEEWQELGQYIVEGFAANHMNNFNRVFELSGQQYLNAMTMSFITSSITIGFRYVGTAINRINNYKEISVKNTDILNEDGTIKEGHTASELIFKSSKGNVSQTLTMKETEQQFMQWANEAERIVEKYANVKVVTDENGNKHKEYELTSEISDKDKKKLKTIATALTNAAQIIGQYYNAVGDAQFKAAMSTLDQIAEETEQRKRIVANGGYVQYANAMIQRAHHSAEIKGLVKLGPKLASQRITQVRAWLALDDAVLNAVNLKGEAKGETAGEATGETVGTTSEEKLEQLKQDAIEKRQKEVEAKETVNTAVKEREEAEAAWHELEDQINVKQAEIDALVKTAEYNTNQAQLQTARDTIKNIREEQDVRRQEYDRLSERLSKALANGAGYKDSGVVHLNEQLSTLKERIDAADKTLKQMEAAVAEGEERTINATYNQLIKERDELINKRDDAYDDYTKKSEAEEQTHDAYEQINADAKQAEWDYYNRRLTDMRKDTIENTDIETIRKSREALQGQAQDEWNYTNAEIRDLQSQAQNLKIEVDAKKIGIDALIKSDPEIEKHVAEIRRLQQMDKEAGTRGLNDAEVLAYRSALAKMIRGERKTINDITNKKYATELQDLRDTQKRYNNTKNRAKMLQRSLPKLKSNLDIANKNAREYITDAARTVAANMRKQIAQEIATTEDTIERIEWELERAEKAAQLAIETDKDEASYNKEAKELRIKRQENEAKLKSAENDLQKNIRLKSDLENQLKEYESYDNDADWVQEAISAVKEQINEVESLINDGETIVAGYREVLKGIATKSIFAKNNAAAKSTSRLKTELQNARQELSELKQIQSIFEDWLESPDAAYNNFMGDDKDSVSQAATEEQETETKNPQQPQAPKFDTEGYLVPEFISTIAESNLNERDKNKFTELKNKTGDNAVFAITGDGRGVVRQTMEVNGKQVVYYFIPQAVLDADSTVGEIMKMAQENDLLYDLATNETWAPVIDKLVKLFKDVYGEDHIKAPDATALGEFADTDLKIGVVANLLYNGEFMELAILSYAEEVLQFCGQLPAIFEAIIDKNANLSHAEQQIRDHVNKTVANNVKELLKKYCGYYYNISIDSETFRYSTAAPHLYELMRTLPIFSQEDIKEILTAPTGILPPIVQKLTNKARGIKIDTQTALNKAMSGLTADQTALINNFITWYEQHLSDNNKKLSSHTTFEDWRKQLEKANTKTIAKMTESEIRDFTLAFNDMKTEMEKVGETYVKYIDPTRDSKDREKRLNFRQSAMNGQRLANGYTMATMLFNNWLMKNGLTMNALIDFFDNKNLSALPQQYQEMYKDLTVWEAMEQLQQSFEQIYNFNFDWSKGGPNHNVDRMITEKPRQSTPKGSSIPINNPLKMNLGVGINNEGIINHTDALFTYLPVEDSRAILHDIVVDDIPPEFAAYMTLDDLIAMPQFINLDKIKEFVKENVSKDRVDGQTKYPNQFDFMNIDLSRVNTLYPGNDAFEVLRFYLMTKYSVDVFTSRGHAYMFDVVGYADAFTSKMKEATGCRSGMTRSEFGQFLRQRIDQKFVTKLRQKGIVKTDRLGYRYAMLSDIIDSKYIFGQRGMSDIRIYFYTNAEAKGNLNETQSGEKTIGGYQAINNRIMLNTSSGMTLETLTHEITHLYQAISSVTIETTTAARVNLIQIMDDENESKVFFTQNREVIRDILGDISLHRGENALDLQQTTGMIRSDYFGSTMEESFRKFLYFSSTNENQAYKNFQLPTYFINETVENGIHKYDISFAWGSTYTLEANPSSYSITFIGNDNDGTAHAVELTGAAENVLRSTMATPLTSISYDTDYAIDLDVNDFNNEPDKQKAFKDLNDKANNRSVVPIETAREEMLNSISDLLNTENLDDTTKAIYQELQKAIDGIKHKGQAVRDTSSYQLAQNLTDAFKKIDAQDLMSAFDNPQYLEAVHKYMYVLYCGEHSTLSYDEFLDTPLPSFNVNEVKKQGSQWHTQNGAYIGTLMPTDGNISMDDIINLCLDPTLRRVKLGNITVQTIRAKDVVFVNGDGIAAINWLAQPNKSNTIAVENGQIGHGELDREGNMFSSTRMRINQIFPSNNLWGTDAPDMPETIYVSDTDGKPHGVSLEEFAQRGLYVNEMKNIKSDQIVVDQKNDMIYVLYNDGETYNMIAETLSHNAHLVTREAWRQKVEATGAIELGKDTEAELIVDIAEKIVRNPNVDIEMRQKVIDLLGERLGQLDQDTNITTPDKVSFTTNDGTRILFPAFTKSKDGKVTITDNSRDDDVHFNATDIKYMHALDPNRLEQADETPAQQPQAAPEEQPAPSQAQQTSMFDQDDDNPVPYDATASIVTPTVVFGKDISEYASMTPNEFARTVGKMSADEFLTLQSAFDIYFYKTVMNNADMRTLPFQQLRMKALTMGTLAYRMADYSGTITVSKDMLNFFKSQADRMGAKKKSGELNSSHVLSDYFLAKLTGNVIDFTNYIQSLSFGDLQRLYNELSHTDIVNTYLDEMNEKRGGNIENYAVSVKILRQTINNDLSYINTQLLANGIDSGLLLKNEVIEADGNSGLSAVDITNLLVLSHDDKVAYARALNATELGAVQSMALNYYEIMQKVGLNMTLINDLIGTINSEMIQRTPPTDKRSTAYKTFARTAARLGKDVDQFEKSIHYNTKNRNLYLQIFANRSFGEGIQITGEPLDIYNTLTASGITFEKTRQNKAENIMLQICELNDPFTATTEGHEYGDIKEAKNKEGALFYTTELTNGNISNMVGYANVIDILATLTETDLDAVMEQTFGLIYQNAMGEKYTNSVTMDYKTYTTLSAKINAMLNAKTRGAQSAKAQAYTQMFNPLIKAAAAYQAYSSLFASQGAAAGNDIACQLYIAACMPTYYKYDYICNNINESEYAMYYALLKDTIATMTYSQNNKLKTSLRELMRVFEDVFKNRNESSAMQNMYDAITKGVIDTNNMSTLYAELVLAMHAVDMRREILASSAPEEAPVELPPRKTSVDRDANTPSEVTNVLNGGKYTIKSTRVSRAIAEGTNLADPELGFIDPDSNEPLYLPKRVQGFIVESNFNKNVDRENVISQALIDYIKLKNGIKTKGKRGKNIDHGTLHFTESDAVDFIRIAEKGDINEYTFNQLNKWFYQNPLVTSFKQLDELVLYSRYLYLVQRVIDLSAKMNGVPDIGLLYNPNARYSSAKVLELYNIINNDERLKTILERQDERLYTYIDAHGDKPAISRDIYDGNLRAEILKHFEHGTFADLKYAFDIQFMLSESLGREEAGKGAAFIGSTPDRGQRTVVSNNQRQIYEKGDASNVGNPEQETTTRMANMLIEMARTDINKMKKSVRIRMTREIYIEEFRALHTNDTLSRMSDAEIWETQFDGLSENEKTKYIRKANSFINKFTNIELLKAYFLATEYQGPVDLRNIKALNPTRNAYINEALLEAFGEERMTERTGGTPIKEAPKTWRPSDDTGKTPTSEPEPTPEPPARVSLERQRQSIRAMIDTDIKYLTARMSLLNQKLLQKNHPNLFTYDEKTDTHTFITRDVMFGQSTIALESLSRELRNVRGEYLTGMYGPQELKAALTGTSGGAATAADIAAMNAQHQNEMQKLRDRANAAIDAADQKYLDLLEKHNALKKQLQSEHESTRSIVKQVKDANISIILTSDTDTPVPELLVNILNTTLDELNTSNRNVQFVTNNENFENLALNMKKFFEANTALFAQATQKEWEDVINFLFQSTLGNNMYTADADLTSTDKCDSTKAYEIFTLWTLAWLMKMQGAGNYAFDETMSARLEAAYSHRASFGGAYLQAVSQAVDFLNPYRDFLSWLSDEYKIDITSEDVQGFAEAVMWDLGRAVNREDLIKVGVPLDKIDELLNGNEEIRIDEHNKADIVGAILKSKADQWLPGIKNANSGHPFEKLFAWEQMCLLSWPGTWIRNISSNIMLQSLNSVSDQIGRLFGRGKRTAQKIEKIQEYVNEKNEGKEAKTSFYMYQIAGIHPTEEMVTAVDNLFDSVISVNPTTGKEETFWQILSNSSTKYADMARTASGQKMSNGERLVTLTINSFAKRLKAENRFSTRDKWVKTDKKTGVDTIKEKSKFNANKEKVLNKTSNLLFKALSDDPWIRRTTRKLFTRMLTERGISPNAVNFNNNDVLDIFADAYTEASWQYMHKKSPMASLDESIKKKLGDGGWFVWKQLMPFANATWNWGMEALNFSPVGLIRGIIQLCRLDKNYIRNDTLLDMGESVPSGNLALYNARKMIGKGVVGTLLFGLGAGAAALGIIGIDKNDDKIKLYFGDDRYIDVSSLFATSSFLAGAGFIYTMCCTDDDSNGKLWAAISSVLDSLFDDSIFNDFLNSFEYSTSIGDWITYNVINAFSAFVPNLYRKIIENSYDFTIQYDSGILGQIEKLGTKIIPGLAYTFPKKYDIYTGEAVSTYRIPFLWKWVNSLSPIDWEPYNVSTQEQIARALGVNKGLLTGDYDDIGKLTTEQKVFLNEMYGKLNKQSLEELMANKKAVNVQNEDGTYSTLKWNNMTDKQKAAAINSLMTKNASYAKTYVYVTYMGGKYYASETEYAELKKLGIKKNVYLATGAKSGYV